MEDEEWLLPPAGAHKPAGMAGKVEKERELGSWAMTLVVWVSECREGWGKCAWGDVDRGLCLGRVGVLCVSV